MFLETRTEVGERLFGRSLRLRVLTWVSQRQDSVFFQGEAARSIGYTASAVTQELERLSDLGLLTRHDRTPGERRVYYSKTDSRLWPAIVALIDAIEGEFGPQDADRGKPPHGSRL